MGIEGSIDASTSVLASSVGNPMALHRALWGKADPARADRGPTWHPLVAHLLDVAACAEKLLVDVRPQRLASMAAVLGLSSEQALSWLLFFVVLHDLGKATPAFQAKVADAKVRLSAIGFDFPDSDEPHGEMSVVLVPEALEARGVPGPLAFLVARAVGAHHGAFADAGKLNEIWDVSRHKGKKAPWGDARKALVEDLATLFGLSGTPTLAKSIAARHAFAVDLAGLTTTADWLGSNADIFTYVAPDLDLRAHFDSVRKRTTEAVTDVGFRRAPSATSRSFEALFGKTPWPLHRAMANLLPTLRPGALVIVEAAMGEGKTEAALLAYDSLSARGSDGLFFALPTQATANQILGRVERFFSTSFPGVHGLHLVHGGAGLSDAYDELKRRALRLTSIAGAAGSEDEAPVADAWFSRSKRALLAPLGVGTVDQALLGVLRTKHHFLRLHGLAGKVIVVDEVHAYDTFTSSILARTCEWLEALGTTVILLSATLSSPQRASLLRAYGAEPPTALPSYPRITIAEKGNTRVIPFESRRTPVVVKLEWKSPDSLPKDVAEILRHGACVAWIVNTVARAQTLYLAMKALRAAGALPPDVDLQLIHARLPFSDRLAREKKADRAFGPPGERSERPRSALLIGTQVLEQSLDFDFDLMITEVAPVDLVLQRAGRLHRHERTTRPRGLEQRRIWLEVPAAAERDEGPDFGASKYVYDEAIVLASYLVLRGQESVAIPTDIEPLVEAVYVERSDGVGDMTVTGPVAVRLREARATRSQESAGDRYKAEQKQLPAPSHDSPFTAFSCFFDEEDPAVHEALRATTRLGDPSVTVVPVFATRGGYRLATDPSVVFDPDAPEIPFLVARKLARSALAVSSRQLVPALLGNASAYPRAFKRSRVLGHHWLLVLDERGRAVIGKTHVALDSELGLLVGALAAEPLV